MRENLELLISSLVKAGAILTVDLYVRPVLRLINSFGLHLARLDVRQNSDAYDLALGQMMEAAGIDDGQNFRQWTLPRKLEFLNQELNHPRPMTHASMELPAEAEEVRATFSELVDHLDARGPEGLGCSGGKHDPIGCGFIGGVCAGKGGRAYPGKERRNGLCFTSGSPV